MKFMIFNCSVILALGYLILGEDVKTYFSAEEAASTPMAKIDLEPSLPVETVTSLPVQPRDEISKQPEAIEDAELTRRVLPQDEIPSADVEPIFFEEEVEVTPVMTARDRQQKLDELVQSMELLYLETTQ